MARPTVSVLMPCHDSTLTLGLALASLKTQTFESWECVVVDDGSSDDPEAVIRSADDARIRTLKLPRERGRGSALSLALSMARGALVTGLDADDWCYPDKLACQVAYLAARPQVTAVGVGLALVDGAGRLVGIQQARPGLYDFDSQGLPRGFSFAPTMIRTGRARTAGFDPTLRRGQDFDFYTRALTGERFAVLPRVGYCYSFERGTSARVVLESLSYNLRRLGGRAALVCRLKLVSYAMLHRLGLWELLRRLRRTRPDPCQRREFLRASRVLASCR